MRHTEQPITDYATEVHLTIDRLKEAARLEKEATWQSARDHCARIDKATCDAIEALRPVAGLPSIHLLANEDEVSTATALTVLGRLGRLARGEKAAA